MASSIPVLEDPTISVTLGVVHDDAPFAVDGVGP
jgi:hypothetical protein